MDAVSPRDGSTASRSTRKRKIPDTTANIEYDMNVGVDVVPKSDWFSDIPNFFVPTEHRGNLSDVPAEVVDVNHNQQVDVRKTSTPKSGEFVCSKCGRAFHNKYGIDYHTSREVCNQSRRVTHDCFCPTCNKGFISELGLKYHVDKGVCAKKAANYAIRAEALALKIQAQEHVPLGGVVGRKRGRPSKNEILMRHFVPSTTAKSSNDIFSSDSEKDDEQSTKMSRNTPLLPTSSAVAVRELLQHALTSSLGRSPQQEHINQQTENELACPSRTRTAHNANKLPIFAYLSLRKDWISHCALAKARRSVALSCKSNIASIEQPKLRFFSSRALTCLQELCKSPFYSLGARSDTRSCKVSLTDNTCIPITSLGDWIHHVNEKNVSGRIDVPSVELLVVDTSAHSRAQSDVRIAPLTGIARSEGSQYECFLNAGGPIWSAAFAPDVDIPNTDATAQLQWRPYAHVAVCLSRIGFPHDRERGSDSFSASCTRSACAMGVGSDCLYDTHKRYTHPSLLQIWALMPVTGDNSFQPQLRYSIGMQRGPLWKVHWCPFLLPSQSSAIAPADDRTVTHAARSLNPHVIGIVAVVCGDGSCVVIAPPTLLPGNSNRTAARIVAAASNASETVLIEEADVAIWSYSDDFSEVTCASWSPFVACRLCLGMSDGTCGVWDIDSNASESRKFAAKALFWIPPAYIPMQPYLSSSKALGKQRISAVQFCPYHPSLLFSAGADNLLRVWNLEDLSRPLLSRGFGTTNAGESRDHGRAQVATWDPTGLGVYAGGWDSSNLLWEPAGAYRGHAPTGAPLPTAHIPEQGAEKMSSVTDFEMDASRPIGHHFSKHSCVWDMHTFEYDNQTILLSAASDGSVRLTFPSYAGKKELMFGSARYDCGSWLALFNAVGEPRRSKTSRKQEPTDATSDNRKFRKQLSQDLKTNDPVAPVCIVNVKLSCSKFLSAEIDQETQHPTLAPAALAIHCVHSAVLNLPLIEATTDTASEAYTENSHGILKLERVRMCIYGGAAGLLRMHSLDVPRALHKISYKYEKDERKGKFE